MKINTKLKSTPIYTHEGARAVHINSELQLRRSVLACMLWEGTFYESGESIADRIANTIPKVKAEKVAELAIEARTKAKLRHAPLLLAREMARLETHKHVVQETLAQIIQRPDELTEFLSIYWKDGKQPLANSVKRGLARAMSKFKEYALAKYNRQEAIKLRDVLFLVHSKPSDIELGGSQKAKAIRSKNYKRSATDRHLESVYTRLVENRLAVPDTWEVELSKSKDKTASWTRLLKENKLGAMALLRNLRNMEQAGVDQKLIRNALVSMKPERVLPFRFISAAKYAPHFEPELEKAMYKNTEEVAKLSGRTVIVVDGSGSMFGTKVSEKSEIDRFEAAAALAILAREICEDAYVLVFSNSCFEVPARRGFALRDALYKMAEQGGTDTRAAINKANYMGYDRMILITDEQSHTSYPDPIRGKQAYVINVAVYKNGIGYGRYTHIDGWSESVLDYIAASERLIKED